MQVKITIRISQPSADIRFSSVTSDAELASMLGFSFSAKGGYGPFSASANAHYEETMKNTSHDMHFNYYQAERSSVSYVIPSVGNNGLRPDARDLLVNGGGLDLFTSACGDSFVNNAYIGALLVVDIAIHFDSKDAKSKFEASIKGKAMGIASVAAEFEKSSAYTEHHATLSVQAMQNGGDVTKFAKIFVTDKKPNYAVVDCSGGNPSRCVEMIQGVIDYAAGDFADSIDFTKPDNLYVYGYSEKSYKSIAIQAYLPDLTETEQNANDFIRKSVEHDKMMLDYLNAYKKQGELIKNISTNTYNMLDKSIDAYTKLVDLYRNYQILDACYGDTNNLERRCLETANTIKNHWYKEYKDYIDFASNLGNTIVAQRVIDKNHFSYLLVPLDGTCNNVAECQGEFALYRSDMTASGSVTTFQNATCLVDTTSDNYYFKNQYKDYVGKIYVCTTDDPRIKYPMLHSYIKRASYEAGKTDGDTTTGIWGTYNYSNPQKEVDDPVDSHGINTQMLFSDSSKLLYNPI